MNPLEFFSFLYFCHLANLSGLKILQPFGLIDKTFRLGLAIVLLLKWAIVVYVVKHLGKKITTKETIRNVCFHYSNFTFGYLFPKILGFRTIYTKKIDMSRPMIYISNHHHLVDGWPISVTSIPAYWMAKHDLHVEIPILGPLLLKHVLDHANLFFYQKKNK